MNLTDAEINAALLPLDVPGSIEATYHANCLECRAWAYPNPLTRKDADTLRLMLYTDRRDNCAGYAPAHTF